MAKRAILILSFLAVWAGSTAALDEPKWEWVGEKEGIHVWQHEIPGSDMPGFRGQGFIKASIDQILKEMLDWKHHPDWMFGCKESRPLKVFNNTHGIMYNRTEAPWPVWDRDVIVDTVLERSSDKRYLLVAFKNISYQFPVPQRVIRLPRLVGFYKLWEVEPMKTKVLYQVETDAGGSLPRWLALFGAKALPYETLNALRKRVEDKHKS